MNHWDNIQEKANSEGSSVFGSAFPLGTSADFTKGSLRDWEAKQIFQLTHNFSNLIEICIFGYDLRELHSKSICGANGV